MKLRANAPKTMIVSRDSGSRRGFRRVVRACTRKGAKLLTSLSLAACQQNAVWLQVEYKKGLTT